MTSKANAHVSEYLSYYLDLPHEPHFAVLLDGPWGIGKTFLLDNFLKEKFAGTDKKYVKVSLYGLSTIAEIDDALFHAIFPLLTGSGAKAAGRVVKAGLKFFKIDVGDFNLRDLPGLEKFNPQVYVFDDLERCDAPLNKVLGYINQFVEHSGAKVIVVANQAEIKGDEDYDRRREKLFGKTLRIRSSFDEAFSYFVSKIDNDAAKKQFFGRRPKSQRSMNNQRSTIFASCNKRCGISRGSVKRSTRST